MLEMMNNFVKEWHKVFFENEEKSVQNVRHFAQRIYIIVSLKV